jgi:serine phosphatase RsbU (regulator of sigma subunit)
MPFSMKKYIILSVLLDVATMWSVAGDHISADTKEKGYPSIFNFSPKTYSAADQNWAVLQDNRGVMYFANNRGILEYDGVNWTLIDVSDGKAVFSLAKDHTGRIYSGSVDEFGYIAPDSIGQMKFISLTPLLNEEYLSFGVVWKTFATPEGIVFQTYDYIFIFNNDTIQALKPQTSFQETYYVNQSLYVRQEDVGLTIYNDGKFQLVNGGEQFAGMQIWGMVPYDSGSIIVATTSELYKLDLYGQGNRKTSLTRFQTEADSYFSRNDIYSVIPVDESHYSVGTWGGGVVVIDNKGVISESLDKGSGLEDNIIANQYIDDRNNLWLALSYGISRVEINSPLTIFDDRSGLTGSIQSITRFNNTIYIATLAGLFYLSPAIPAGNDALPRKSSFRLLEDGSFESWDLLKYQNKGEELLLVVTNDAIMEVDKNNRVTKLPFDYIPYDLYQSRLIPNRIYIGLESGLASIYRKNGRWEDEGRIKGIDENINQMSEDIVGNLWMGTPDEGVIKLNILSLEGDRMEEIKVSKFDTTYGLPGGPAIVSQITGQPVIATSEGLYKYNPLENWFKPDTTFGNQFADGSHFIHRISEYGDKGIWMITYTEDPKQAEDEFKAGYLNLLPDDSYEWVTEPFIRITEEILYSIFTDDDQVVWLGGTGLYRYELQNEKDFRQDYPTLIRKITLGADSLIFGGTNFDENGRCTLVQPPSLYYTLPYRYNSLIFDYAAQPGEDESFLRFSYFLEGFDQKWSDWSDLTKKEYTNLREGTYTFHVKAKNVYNHEGQEASFSFTVLPPWYRTIVAYLGYLVFFVVFVYTVVKVYTRQLRAIIRERTAEVVMQKEEIEIKNREITDSIQYASRIQSAILPPGDYVKKILPDRFILYLPRDIVSGDFYWLNELNSKVITVAADCTGHGVPGAFMSMLGVAFLNEIVSKVTDIHAHEILNQLRTHVIKSLHQTGAEGESKDGMDIALCVYDLPSMKLEYSGANNPLYLIRDNEVIIYKADKMPIGIHALADQSFTLNVIDLKKGDIIYTFSDGYEDQFGGPNGKKFMAKNMRELLLKIHKEDMETQKTILKDTLYDWMKHTEQIDDVIVMGVRV